MTDHNDLGPLPTVHPRHATTEMAKRELEAYVLDWQQRHKLTLPEELFLLTDLLHYKLSLAVKHERKS